jgi:hypothetical protein
MRTSSIVFTGRDHPIASELPINGDASVARSRFTNVYRVTGDESFLAYQVPTTNSMTTYAFEVGDIDDEYFIEGSQVGTTLTPYGTVIGARLDHPSSKIDLEPGTALQIYDDAQHSVQGTVHCDAGWLRLEPGEGITIISNKGKKEDITVYPTKPSSTARLNPGEIDFPCGSNASHSTRRGWKIE